MDGRQTLLNHLLDIGGVATKNNFYSPTSSTLIGSFLMTNRYFKELANSGLIEQLPYAVKPRNKRQETFYRITPKGADYIGRREDYKYRNAKQPNNIMHDSMMFDVALSFLRGYSNEFSLIIRYDRNFNGL